jgi:drug/metabolite transporter (DMT)-like permease
LRWYQYQKASCNRIRQAGRLQIMTMLQRLPVRLLLALAVTWLAFGSGYVATKVGVAAVPPFLFSGPRFVLGGLALLIWATLQARGRLRLTWRELAEAAVVGVGTIFAGQGAVTWASSELSPGVVAVVASTVPLWAALLAWAFLGSRVSGLALAGLVAGFLGICLLASPSGAGVRLLPVLLVAGGSLTWAAGSLVAGRSRVARRPLVLAAFQLLTGGLLQIVLGLALGEPGQLHLSAIGPHVVIAFVYLTLAVSILGFATFAWLLAGTSPAVANSQAYVGPVVALVLGLLLLGTPMSLQAVLASGMSLAGVALLVAGQARARRTPAVDAELGEAA